MWSSVIGDKEKKCCWQRSCIIAYFLLWSPVIVDEKIIVVNADVFQKYTLKDAESNVSMFLQFFYPKTNDGNRSSKKFEAAKNFTATELSPSTFTSLTSKCQSRTGNMGSKSLGGSKVDSGFHLSKVELIWLGIKSKCFLIMDVALKQGP